MRSEELTHLSFNTGRRYTAEDQRIDVVAAADGYVYFYDRSRCITGRFPRPDSACRSDRELQALVMKHYDFLDYENTGLWEFEQVWKAATASMT